MTVFDALRKNILTLSRPEGRNILDRTREFGNWVQARRDYKIWPFSTTINTRPETNTVVVREDCGEANGINVASQDYLSLTNHPLVIEAAKKALEKYGPHSAGAAILQGNTLLSRRLEAKLSEALEMKHVVLYPTGWGAGYGAITGLVRPNDVVVIDELAHACLQAGATAATSKVIRHKHLKTETIPSILSTLRNEKGHNDGILVVTEGLFSMDADIPSLGPLQDSCREHDATLLVDIAHDFGAMGPKGSGVIGMQNLLGKVDLVMGSFSKTFASNGGFVATQSEHVRDFLRVYSSPHTFSNALSPIQTAVILACLEIVISEEGETRRNQLLAVASHLRNALAEKGVTCLGVPSPIIPAMIGAEDVARLASKHLFTHKVFANLVEFPGVPVKAARFRLQIMSDHSFDEADKVAVAVAASIRSAEEELYDLSRASGRNEMRA